MFNWPIIGHNKIVNYLQRSIEKDRLSHAYLFYGVAHLGKKTIAKYFVQSSFCKSIETTPCGKCAHCMQFDERIHPDLTIVKRITDSKTGKLKKNISIEQVRKIKDKLALSSFSKKYKIAIIEEADKLSIGAANSLLKILEEPVGKTIFILIASNVETVLPTIISRCQQIKFLPVPFVKIYDYLVDNKGVPSSEALDLSALVQGKPGLIDYFLAEENLKIYYQNLNNNLDLTNQGYYHRIKFANNILLNVSELEGQKKIVIDFLDDWQSILRDLVLVKNTSASNSKIKLIHNTFLNSFEKESQKYPNIKLINLLDKIRQSKLYLANNVSPKMVLESFVLEL